MRNKNANLVPQVAFDASVEQMTTDVSVNGAQRIIHQVDVCIDVKSSSQADSSLLPAAERHSSLPHWREVSIREHAKVFL